MPGADVVSPTSPQGKAKAKGKTKPAPTPIPAPGTESVLPAVTADAGAPTADGGAPSGDAGAPSVDGGVPDGGNGAVPPVPGPDGGAPDAAAPPIVEAPPPPPPPPSGKGRVEGTVIDAKTGEPMIEAQVTVLETKKKVLTDIDGNYQLSLPPGTYSLRVWAEMKAGRRISSVVVERGKTTRIDVSLGEDTKVVMQELVVVAKPDTATEAVQLVRRQKAATVSDAISAEQLSRTPDTNASEAVKRVVGATIQDNKYVIIRGLGSRYSAVLLNGISVPSPDPDLPTAPLDLFPAALLANLTVAKTFSPDLPGTFAGGALLIETRDYPSKFMLKLRLGTAVDSTATFRQANTHKGGSLDFLGYDDGARDLPGEILRDKKATTDDGFTPDQLAVMGRAFPNNWDLYKRRALPALGLGVTVGDTLSLGGRKLGYLGSVLYGNRWTRQKAHIAQLDETSATGGYMPSRLQQEADTGIESASVGALLNVGFTISSTHRLGLISMYMHNTEKSTTQVRGADTNGPDIYTIDRLRFRFIERMMQFNQLTGEHAFSSGRVVMTWQGHLALTSQHEPDSRDLLRLVPANGGPSGISTGTGSAERTFGELQDKTGGAGADFTAPFRPIKLKAGGSFTYSPRTSRVRRFHYEMPSITQLSSQAAFAPDNIGPGKVEFEERTNPEDGFDANRTVYNAYLMGDLVRLEPFRVIGGLRFDLARTELMLNQSIGSTTMTQVNRQDRALLPALNAVYALSGRSNLRAAYGGTVARPHLRELSKAPYFDFVRGRVIAGNPDLIQTYIHNADLRWELFPSGAEVLAASAFYKYFQNPIERTVEQAGSEQNVNFTNSDHAHEAGVELEARISGSRFHPKLEPLYLGANLAYIYSRVQTTAPMSGLVTYRALQGQSPYVVNAEIGYRRGGTQLSLLYNVYGRRISEAGAGGNGDVYEEAFHRLDLTLNQKLAHGFTLKVSGTNLLNQRYSFRQGPGLDSPGDPNHTTEIYGYRPGVTGLAVVEWSYEGANK